MEVKMQTVTHTEFKELFTAYYESKEPVFLHGRTGIGKSQVIKHCARRRAEQQGREFVDWEKLDKDEKKTLVENPEGKFVFVDMRMAEVEPSDLRGLPDFEEEFVDWKPPLWVAAVCSEGASGVVFLDEANLAPELVQSVFYQLVLDRKISEQTLADDVYVIGAGNVTEDKAHIHQFAGPLRDRFAHLRLETPDGGVNGGWVEWAVENDIDPAITGFIGSDVGRRNLYTFTEDNADAMAFATPRAWEKVDNVIDTVSEMDVKEKLIASFVGTGTATEFIAFLERKEAFNVSEYIQNPSKAVELNETQFDETHAALSALADAYERGDTDVETIVSIGEVLDTEYAAYLLTLCRQYSDDPATFRNELRTASSAEFAREVVKVIS